MNSDVKEGSNVDEEYESSSVNDISGYEEDVGRITAIDTSEMACFRMVREGTCPNGLSCKYSHDTVKVSSFYDKKIN